MVRLRNLLRRIFLVLSDFIEAEVGQGRSTASNSLLSLEEMYSNQELVMKIHAQLKLVKDKNPTLLSLLSAIATIIVSTTFWESNLSQRTSGKLCQEDWPSSGEEFK